MENKTNPVLWPERSGETVLPEPVGSPDAHSEIIITQRRQGEGGSQSSPMKPCQQLRPPCARLLDPFTLQDRSPRANAALLLYTAVSRMEISALRVFFSRLPPAKSPPIEDFQKRTKGFQLPALIAHRAMQISLFAWSSRQNPHTKNQVKHFLGMLVFGWEPALGPLLVP
ncbi:hypothetical protein BDY21DRAFT_106560 [Lineolata rhizophorae]|uniref:Uncharacterized protein n=1 Tax=Lineolata rhizophorae TaxID=578093 RepID=A0A6A6NRZ5_9PEZI|nr:hypothetical protein BDY21DRAFT_106560 [Lineolata rhizophorae]